jgi:membrane protein CcdC involved in cytochrome C biogenesis
MERRQQLRKFIQRAKNSLTFERSLPIAQYGLFLALLSSALLVFVSRLFVWPYYRQIALATFIIGILVTVVLIWWRRVKEKEALHALDHYFSHNELVTALSFKDDKDPLVQSLLTKAVQKSEKAFAEFKARKKNLFRTKAFVGLFVTAVVIAVLYMFPAATQIEAIEVEKEKAVIEDIKKEVAKLEKKAETKEVKEQLKELQNTLKETQTAEEALREVVKKQKELALKEQQLKDKQTVSKEGAADNNNDALSKEEIAQLKELAQTQQQLTQSANTTQTAMSNLGKPASNTLQNAIASANSTNNNQQSNSNSNQHSSGNAQPSSQKGQSGQQGQNNSQNGSQQATGNGQSQGNQQGQGQGQGRGQGQGQGQGTGAGRGQGSRNLLTTPRIGGSNETTVDGGQLGDGSHVSEQQGNGPITKGSIKPYEEVIGSYKDSYLESSERLQLPKDLQQVVQSYFTTIEQQ